MIHSLLDFACYNFVMVSIGEHSVFPNVSASVRGAQRGLAGRNGEESPRSVGYSNPAVDQCAKRKRVT